MIGIFISVGPYTNDKRRLHRQNSSVSCGVVWGGALPLSKNTTFWYILVTIICSHCPIGGHYRRVPL